MIDYLVTKLDKNISDDEASIENIHSFSKDIIILDYLLMFYFFIVFLTK